MGWIQLNSFYKLCHIFLLVPLLYLLLSLSSYIFLSLSSPFPAVPQPSSLLPPSLPPSIPPPSLSPPPFLPRSLPPSLPPSLYPSPLTPSIPPPSLPPPHSLPLPCSLPPSRLLSPMARCWSCAGRGPSLSLCPMERPGSSSRSVQMNYSQYLIFRILNILI